MTGAAGPERPFAEPWHAQVFAITLALHERSVFGWDEWAKRLGASIADAGHDLDGGRYYECWLVALQGLLADRGLVGADALRVHTDEWDRAARATPHGQPIEPPLPPTEPSSWPILGA